MISAAESDDSKEVILAKLIQLDQEGEQYMMLDMYYIQSHSQQRHCRGLGILIPSFWF
jgi:hypothetical protein